MAASSVAYAATASMAGHRRPQSGEAPKVLRGRREQEFVLGAGGPAQSPRPSALQRRHSLLSLVDCGERGVDVPARPLKCASAEDGVRGRREKRGLFQSAIRC